jgi:hypothetical protein
VLEVAMQIGPRSALPTVDFAMLLGGAKPDEGGDAWILASVKKASPAKEQFGQLPPGIEKDIASFQGTQIRVPLPSAAAESDAQALLPKGAFPPLERLVLNATEALIIDSVPAPEQAVGAGAQWIAETRMTWSGVDVIAYRAFRVKSVEAGRAHLTIDVKGYATQKEPALEGLPKGATLEQFDAEAQGEIELVPGEWLARRATVQQRVAMIFQTPGAAGLDEPSGPGGQPARNMGSFQSQGEAKLVRGDDIRAATR